MNQKTFGNPKKGIQNLSGWLTSQEFYRNFTSPFELVGYAIEVAKSRIASGRESTVNTDIQNISYQVLSEILNGKELITPLSEELSRRELPPVMTKEELMKAITEKGVTL